MANRALHAAAVLLPILVTRQTNVPAPLGQPRLIRPLVAGRARRDVGQLRHVVCFGVPGVAEAAVHRYLVVEGVAPRARLVAPASSRILVAGSARKAHVRMGLVQEFPHGRHQSVLGNPLVTEGAVRRRRVMEGVAAVAGGLGHRHAGSLMARVTSEAHGQVRIVEEAPARKRNRVPLRCLVAEAASPG